VAVTIIGIVVAALFNGLIATTMGSVTHRSLVNPDNFAQSYLETAEYDIQQARHFQPCPSASTYNAELAAAGWVVPSSYAGYSVSIARVEYWTTSSPSCPNFPGTTSALQLNGIAVNVDCTDVAGAGEYTATFTARPCNALCTSPPLVTATVVYALYGTNINACSQVA